MRYLKYYLLIFSSIILYMLFPSVGKHLVIVVTLISMVAVLVLMVIDEAIRISVERKTKDE